MGPFVGKDGSRHTNRDTMDRANARFSAKQTARNTQGSAMGDSDEDDMSGEPQDGAAVAAEHGPAEDVTIQHEHEAGRHHVRTSHPDGHVQESEHATAGDAHRYAAEACGAE